MVNLELITLAFQATAAAFVIMGMLFEASMYAIGEKGPLVSLMRLSENQEELTESVDCIEGKVDDIGGKVDAVEDATLALAVAHNEGGKVNVSVLRQEYDRDDPGHLLEEGD